jgi:hypothetical protein
MTQVLEARFGPQAIGLRNYVEEDHIVGAIIVALFLSLLAIPAWAFGGSVLVLVVGSYVMQTGVLVVIYASIGQFENIHSKNFSLWPFQSDSAKHPVNAGSSWVPNPLRVAGVRRRSRWGMRRLVASTASS